ncbi:MAG: hypothetical protein ACJ8GN_29750 [Longimicrobiaceae bacterium]
MSAPAPRSLFVLALPRSLSSLTYQVARGALGLDEPVWTSDGEVLNSDRFVLHGGPGHDEGRKFTRPAWEEGAARRMWAFLDELVRPAGFAYKDVVQPFVAARWLTAAERGLAVLRIRRPLVDVAASMLARRWLYPARAPARNPPEELVTALLRGLLEAEAALDAVPAVTVDYDDLVRDEAALAGALRALAPGRALGPVRYVDVGFRRVAGERLALRGEPWYRALEQRLAALR